MGHRDVFTAADAAFMPLMGEEATFTPSGGAAVPCYVFIYFNVMLQPMGFDAQVTETGTTIRASLADLGRKPNRDETFTYTGPSLASLLHGTVFAVKAVLENEDGLTVTAVVK